MTLNSLLDHAPIRILVLDNRGRVLRMSRAMAELMHVSGDAYLTTTLPQIIVGGFGARVFPKSSGALCIIDSSKNLIEVVAGWGDSSAFEPVFSLEECWALREGRLHVVHDSTAELVCAHVIVRTGSQLCV